MRSKAIAQPVSKIGLPPKPLGLKMDVGEYCKARRKRKKTWEHNVACFKKGEFMRLKDYIESLQQFIDTAKDKEKAQDAAIDRWLGKL